MKKLSMVALFALVFVGSLFAQQLPILQSVTAVPPTITVDLSTQVYGVVGSSIPNDRVGLIVNYGDLFKDTTYVVLDGTNLSGIYKSHVWQTKGVKTITAQAINANGVSAPMTTTITVTNTAPVITSISQPSTGTVGQPVSITFKGRNPDGKKLTFSINPGNGTSLPPQPITNSVSNTELTAVFTATYAAAGVYTITYTLDDNQGDTVTDTRTITVTGTANSAPVATNVIIVGGNSAVGVLVGNYIYRDVDGDIEGGTTFKWYRNNIAIVGATSQTYVKTVADLGALIKFEVTAIALTGALVGLPVQSSTIGPIVNANSAPVVSISGQTFNGTTATLSWSGNDANGDLIFYSYSLDGGAWINYSADTSVTYNNLTAGNHTFQVKCRDAQGLEGNTATTTFTITPANQSPVITSLSSPSTGIVGTNVSMTIKAKNPDGTQLRVTMVVVNGISLISPVMTGALNEELSFNFVASFLVAGTYTVNFTVDDLQGGTTLQSCTILISPLPVNIPPDITNITTLNVFQNQRCIIKVTVIDTDSRHVWLKYKYETVTDSLLCSVIPGVKFVADVPVTFTKAGPGVIEFWARDSVATGGHISYSLTVSPVTGVEDFKSLPNEFALLQNYPNPFNPTTTISYQLPEAANVALTVVDVTGKEVEQLISGYKSAGQHSVQFNASRLSTGIYFYRISAGKYNETKKMLLIK